MNTIEPMTELKMFPSIFIVRRFIISSMFNNQTYKTYEYNQTIYAKTVDTFSFKGGQNNPIAIYNTEINSYIIGNDLNAIVNHLKTKIGMSSAIDLIYKLVPTIVTLAILGGLIGLLGKLGRD